jgi:cytochrome c oxidase subunit II
VTGREIEAMRGWWVAVAAVLVGAAAVPASAQDAKKVERGKAVYVEQKCKLCHQVGGEGNAKGPLDGVGSKLKRDEIKEWIVDPAAATAKHKATRKPAMKAYPNLSADDLDALVTYMESLKKK